MQSVISKDGSIITYDKTGSGEPVVLVSGGSVDKWSNAGLAGILEKNFTVYNYDRRGRGASTDTAPYAVDREIEDIEAVIGAAGGSAFLFGSSSGAALALEAAVKLGSKVKKLALWEPPYILEGSRPRPPANTAKIYSDFVAQGKRGDAAEYFMTAVVGLPPEFAAQARTQPWWAAQEALAHTLAYDATIMDDYSLPTGRAAKVTMPTTVFAGGGDMPWILDTAKALVKAIPGAQFVHLEGQGHNVAPEVLGPAMTTFFQS